MTERRIGTTSRAFEGTKVKYLLWFSPASSISIWVMGTDRRSGGSAANRACRWNCRPDRRVLISREVRAPGPNS